MLLKILFWTALLGYLGWRVYKFWLKAKEKINFLKQVFNQKNNLHNQQKDDTISKQFGDITVTWKKK